MLTRRQFVKRSAVVTGGLLVSGLGGCDGGESGSTADTSVVSDATESSGDPNTGDSLAENGPPKYNILMITVDQLRTLDMLPATVALPAIESLRNRGFDFKNHHIASCVCTPSRSVIYTGRHVPDTKMADNINFQYIADMDPSIKTIGHMLQEAGYYPAYKGKWHLSDVDPPQTDPNCNKTGPTTQKLEAYGFFDYNECGDEHGRMLSGATTDGDTADAAATWLEQIGTTLDKPWFLAVNLVNPHDIMFFDTDGLGPAGSTQKSSTQVSMTPAPLGAPYNQTHTVTMPANLIETFDQRPPGHLIHKQIYDGVFGEIPTDRPDMWENYLNYYVNCVVDVDTQIQTVLNKLDSLGLTDKTIVIFLSDHGELAGAHGVRQKGPFIYRENTNVPFIIAHPDHAGSTEVHTIMSAVDVAPTIAGLAGIAESDLKAAHPDVVGYSFVNLLSDPQATGPRHNKGVLFTYDSLSTIDVEFALANASPFANIGKNCSDVQLDTSKRGFVRAIYDGNHRLARWFSPVEFNSPTNLNELFANNDVELLTAGQKNQSDVHLDPKAAANASLAENLRGALETLINEEIKHEGYVMPDITTCS